METHFHGKPFGDFLRAAEAEANRFHGVHAPAPRRSGRNLRGSLLVAGATLLAVAGAMLLALGPDEPAGPRVTLAARPVASAWFTPPPAGEAQDDAPAGRMPAAGRPPALADTASPADAGSEEEAGTPRIAPMNVPMQPGADDAGAEADPQPAG